MKRNHGYIPPECEIRDVNGILTGYSRVHVRLFNGYDTRRAGADPWPAAGSRPPTNWRISPQPHGFEIRGFELAA